MQNKIIWYEKNQKKNPLGYIYWHNTQWNYFLVQKLKHTLKPVYLYQPGVTAAASRRSGYT